MYDANDFENFYTTHIEPSISQLRADSKRMDKWGFVALLAGLAGFGSFIGYHAGYFSGSDAVLLFGLFAALVVYAVYNISKRRDEFTDDLKNAVIKEMINHFCPGVNYDPDK